MDVAQRMDGTLYQKVKEHYYYMLHPGDASFYNLDTLRYEFFSGMILIIHTN